MAKIPKVLQPHIDAAFPANVDRVHARRLPAHGMDAGGIDRDLLAITEETAEKSQRHGAAADVARANKKDVFHDAGRGGDGLRQRKIKLNQVNETAR